MSDLAALPLAVTLAVAVVGAAGIDPACNGAGGGVEPADHLLEALLVGALARLAIDLVLLEGGGCDVRVTGSVLIIEAGATRNVPSASGTATGLTTTTAAMAARRKVMLNFMVTAEEVLVSKRELVGDNGVELSRTGCCLGSIVSVGEEVGLGRGWWEYILVREGREG